MHLTGKFKYEVLKHLTYIVQSTKIFGIEWLVIAIEAAQVSASEVSNIDKFSRFQTFAQTAIKRA